MNIPVQKYGLRAALSNVTFALALSVAAAAQAEPLELVALGDSLTQGYGLPDGDGLVPQLQAWLDAQGTAVKVVNAGVSGDTTAGGLSRVGWSLTPATDAVMVILGGNDLLRGIPPSEVRANLDGILSEVRGRDLPALLVPMQATTNYGADYKAAFDATYGELAVKHGAQLGQPYFAPLGEVNAASIAIYMQPDGIHPNRDGVAKIVEVLGPQVLALLATVPD